MAEDIYQTVLKQLQTSGLILQEMLPTSPAVKFDCQKLIEVFESSFPLVYDPKDDVLKYTDEDGNVFVAPDISEGVTESSSWLCDKLPLPLYDFDQGGNVYKIQEARAVYTLICVAIVFKDFKDEIKETFQKYDFTNFEFKDKDVKHASMLAYLQTYVDLNSLRINTVISAASIQISRTVEKKDAYWKSALNLDEITEFARISRDIKNVILEYERDKKLNSVEIINLSKIDKLQTIAERDLKIDSIISRSHCSTLYRISKLNSERLSPIAKRAIFLNAQKVATARVKEMKLEGKLADETYNSTFKETSRNLSRMAVTTLKVNEIAKYRLDPEKYVFIKKI